MKSFVAALLLISSLNFSCRGSKLPLPALSPHADLSSFDSKLLVVSHILDQIQEQVCSQPVVRQTFHTILNMGDGSNDMISDDVMTDSQGFLLSLFNLNERRKIPATASLKLCPGSRLAQDRDESSCLVADISSSDVYLIFAAQFPDDKKLTEDILNMRWCLDSNSGSVIRSNESEMLSGAIMGRVNGHNNAIMEKERAQASTKGNGNKGIGGNENRKSNRDIIVLKSRNRRSAELNSATNFRRPFNLLRGRTSNRMIEYPEDMVSRNIEAKRIWGDSGEAWLKRNNDKRMWGDSEEAWLKRNSDKRMWGDSGEAWLKRNYKDEAMVYPWPAEKQKITTNDKMGANFPPEFDPKEEDKRVWGDDGMAWVK